MLVYLTSFTIFSGDFFKKALKMVIFRDFFRHSNPKTEKKSSKSTNKTKSGLNILVLVIIV